MTNITHTFPSPYLRLEATADESTVVVALPSGMEKTLVTAEINPLTGGLHYQLGIFLVLMLLTQYHHPSKRLC